MDLKCRFSDIPMANENNITVIETEQFAYSQLENEKQQLRDAEEYNENLMKLLEEKEEEIAETIKRSKQANKLHGIEIEKLNKIEIIESLNKESVALQSKVEELVRTQETYKKQEFEFNKKLRMYDGIVERQIKELDSVQNNIHLLKCHVSNITLAYEDLKSKYEASKRSIQTMKATQETAKIELANFEVKQLSCAEKFVSERLAKETELNRLSLESKALVESYSKTVKKLQVSRKRLEIKTLSFQTALVNKEKECLLLSETLSQIEKR